MNLKNILTIVGISASTALISVFWVQQIDAKQICVRSGNLANCL